MNISGGLPKIYIQVDLNGTRVSARHKLLYSILRLHKGLMYYFINKEGDYVKTSQDFKEIADLEGVLQISAHYSTFSQFEKLYTGALGVVAKKRMMENFQKDKLDVIDLDKVTKSPDVQRKTVKDSDLSRVGKTCKE